MTLREDAERKAAHATDEAFARQFDNRDLKPANGEQPGLEPSEWAPVAGQALDAATTIAGTQSGVAQEGNPLMRALVARPLAFVAVKVGLAALMNRAVDSRNDAAGRLDLEAAQAWHANDIARWYQLDAAAKKKRRGARWLSGALTFLGVAPALNNVAVIAKGRK